MYCSDISSVRTCVYTNTLGCPASKKHHIEEAAYTVLSAAYKICTPNPEPAPDMSCMKPEDKSMCNLTDAASCLVKLQTSLMCEQPDWKEICL